MAPFPARDDPGIRRERRRSARASRRDARRPIPWAEIESIHAQGHSTRNGALLGSLFGGVIGLAVGAYQPCTAGSALAGTSGNCAQRRAVPIPLGTVGGAALGALIAQRSERWQPIYP